MGAAVGVDGSTENVEAGKGENKEKIKKSEKRIEKARKDGGKREKAVSTARAKWQRASGDDGEGSEILRE
ncbi:hypothetical protein J6TS7_00640 [Paenibacillus dendritiformis]|uniref:hypothetical protein n=1 Tax=Paenibacillus TaxID=44249 RepID=UPI001B26A976|nr:MULTISPECIES: hypothetical protein [Paenibacillus]MEB9897703.1 hypothetical protein [Bacillus cereus]GIO76454.1 hypothetical protein J6TS7_00640 [Paenibacillus dendritiformis]CAH8707931.1 hypothetical protein HTL2_001807 [Paenibacillus melissococcoides]